jgi:N-acetyl-alpha-D-glucosaminyl L-malate synthase BshA
MSRQLRVGIACFASYGGSGVVATELGRNLARLGHKVHFISSQVPFRLQQGEFYENVYYHEVDSVSYDVFPSGMFGLDISSKMTQIAVDENLDLIHAHYAVPHAISGIIAKQILRPRDIKVVTTLHGTDITLVGRAPSYFPLTRWAIEQSDAVTAVSGWLKRETELEFKATTPIHVIHNFVDTRRFAPGLSKCHREHFARPDEKIILHVSNFRPVKRLQDVIGTFKRIVQNLPARLLLIGDGPERERAMDLARRLNVMNRTYFLGKQTQVENYYAIADLLLFPSEHESFGVSALEAMATGVPVVATEGSGLSEVVDHGKTGLLCPVGNIRALTEAAIRILTDETFARELSALARRRAERCFRSDQITQQYVDVYQAVLAGEAIPLRKPCLPEDPKP